MFIGFAAGCTGEAGYAGFTLRMLMACIPTPNWTYLVTYLSSAMVHCETEVWSSMATVYLPVSIRAAIPTSRETVKAPVLIWCLFLGHRCRWLLSAQCLTWLPLDAHACFATMIWQFAC